MKTFHIFSKYFSFIFVLFLVCGCSAVQEVIQTEPSEPSEPSESAAMPLRVTMVYPGDCVGVSAYCDAFHAGVGSAAAGLDIQLKEVSSVETDPSVAVALLREAAQESDLVLTAGYQMEAPLATVAPEFPDIEFVIFDGVLDIPNVAAINYMANEGSFLVGAIAGLKTETGKIGYIGGVDVPLLREFEAGYLAGIHAVNPGAEVIVEYISEDATGFSQPDKAEALALAQYESGVDVIYVAAGGSGDGVLAAALAQQKYIIWVDSNGNHLAPGIVLTSMVKELAASTELVIQETLAGGFMPGIRYLGVEDGGVSYALDAHNRALLSDETLATVESLKAKIISGEIVVPRTVPLPRGE